MIPEEVVTVKIASSTNVISGNTDEPVSDATVEIFVTGNDPVAQLRYIPESDGLYRSETFSPIAGVTYQVRVFAPGYDITFASCFVPPASNLNSITSENVRRVEHGNNATYYFDFGIEFDDPEEKRNFYNLRLYQERKQFFVHPNGDTSYNESIVTPIEFPASSNQDYKLTRAVGGILFIDNPFTDQTIPLSSSIDISKEEIGTIYAELRTVSYDYYLFEESISNTSVGINGGITPSSNVHSNVQNGGGTVSSYSSNSDSLSLVD